MVYICGAFNKFPDFFCNLKLSLTMGVQNTYKKNNILEKIINENDMWLL